MLIYLHEEKDFSFEKLNGMCEVISYIYLGMYNLHL